MRKRKPSYFRWSTYRLRPRIHKEDNALELEIAEMIGNLRFAQNWTQKDLAKEINSTQPVIARLESGWSTPSLTLLKRVADAFDLTVRVEFYAPPKHRGIFRFEDTLE